MGQEGWDGRVEGEKTETLLTRPKFRPLSFPQLPCPLLLHCAVLAAEPPCRVSDLRRTSVGFVGFGFSFGINIHPSIPNERHEYLNPDERAWRDTLTWHVFMDALISTLPNDMLAKTSLFQGTWPH